MALDRAGDTFVVEGGHPLRGRIAPVGNKNEALPALCAALLTAERCCVGNLPRIRDVQSIVDLLSNLGVEVKSRDARTLDLQAASRPDRDPDAELCAAIRGSFLIVPGLLHRCGFARVARPGGDRIGRRRLDTHLLALRQLGAEIEVHPLEYVLRLAGPFRGAEVLLDEASVMATENAVMAASVADGASVILNAACEPHIQGLCRMLCAMGARIRGAGTNRIEIEGVPELGGCCHSIGPDHIEIGSLAAMAAMTRGEITIAPVVADELKLIRLVFERLGVALELGGETLHVAREQRLEIEDDADGAIPTLSDAPWPGFPTDLTPVALALATQARGTLLVHEKMFESRLFFTDRLVAMGARIVLCDPHRAIVSGPAPLVGQRLASPDIRAGMALIAAALSAQGESVIMNANQVDRGYEDIDVRLRQLGAVIERV
jgi:UDP-N-acetylglucosamine 1-carboxyvinyltransferase